MTLNLEMLKHLRVCCVMENISAIKVELQLVILISKVFSGTQAWVREMHSDSDYHLNGSPLIFSLGPIPSGM